MRTDDGGVCDEVLAAGFERKSWDRSWDDDGDFWPDYLGRIPVRRLIRQAELLNTLN